MGTNALWVKVDGNRVVHAVQAARESLDGGQAEVMLDFSSVQRLETDALSAMEALAQAIDGKGTKVVLSNVSVPAYKVLKLMNLTSHFEFRG